MSPRDISLGNYLTLVIVLGGLLVMPGCSSGGGSGGESTTSRAVPSAPPAQLPADPPGSSPLVADFSVTPTMGTAPLVAQFRDASTGMISAWTWNFGDGGASSDQNPQHTYNATGSYTVSLTISGTGGNATSSKNNVVTVNAPPVSPSQPVAQPPPVLSVQVTAPTTGATVSGLTPLVATVSAPAASVQFMADGTPYGTEVTTPPYTVLWNTQAVAPGSHSLAARARDMTGAQALSAPIPVTVVQPAPAAQVGQWSAVMPWPIVAVHAELLSTGQVLTRDGFEYGHDGRLWNPVTGVFTTVPNLQTNLFCSGQCALSDGRSIVAGGHPGTVHTGITDTNLFDPASQVWTEVAPMHVPRWYSTIIELPDGRAMVTGGEMNGPRDEALIPEVYDPQTNVWTQLLGASLSLPYYPHMFVLPDGRVLAAATAEDPIQSQVLNLSTQSWTVVDTAMLDGGSSVQYLPGKIMKSGTSNDPDLPVFASAPTTYVLDMTQASPAWRGTAPMAFPRTYHNLTLLPDGTVLVTGGGKTTDVFGQSSAVHEAERWSPTTETWTTLAPMQTPRLYHSTALLLPDARVLVMGGGRFGEEDDPVNDQFSAEIYSPPYLFQGSRPTITAAPPSVLYGGTFTVQTPDAASIARVSLLRLGAVTHAFNADQRFLQLSFTVSPGTLTVQAPATANLAPPGYYLLFLLDMQGVPSVGAILHLQ